MITEDPVMIGKYRKSRSYAGVPNHILGRLSVVAHVFFLDA